MQFIALINSKVYYDCDCHYGRLVFAKLFDTVDEAKYPEVQILKKGQVSKAYEIGYAWVKMLVV